MMNRAEFKKLALTRLDDARALLKKRRYSVAYYLAGYVVECGLKACLARRTRRYEFPPEWSVVWEFYYTHKLEKLAKASHLQGALEAKNTQLQKYWNIVRGWSEDCRYVPQSDRRRATEMLRAIEDPADGVLQCIRHFW
jgi:HEPN domain-containing protein